MEIRVGDHFIPLKTGNQYGPKKWRVEMRGTVRTFIEIELTALDRLQSDLAGGGNFFEATAPITEADSLSDPALRDYVGGFAVFPRMKHYPVDSPEARKQERLWQAKSEKMHDQQTTLSLEAKPDDGGTTGKYYKELKRGD